MIIVWILAALCIGAVIVLLFELLLAYDQERASTSVMPRHNPVSYDGPSAWECQRMIRRMKRWQKKNFTAATGSSVRRCSWESQIGIQRGRM